MNLETHIRPELWQSVSNTYQTENYSHAILDAMQFLSDALREKAGVDGDGATLVGQALGGGSPKIRVNRLQTETERNVQKGLEQLLRGLYQGIRNPRSHEQIEDDKDTADAVIFFINHLLKILDESEEPFTIPKFLRRVFDPEFVESDHYANLLINEVPSNKRLDTLIEIYRNKCEGDGQKLKYTVNVLLQILSWDQTTDFLAIVSEELKTTHEASVIKTILQILPPHLWLEIDEAARLRIENILIKSMKNGEFNPSRRQEPHLSDGLATWARDFLPNFTLADKEEVAEIFMAKLESHRKSDQWYVVEYFFETLPAVILREAQRQRCIKAISKAVRDEDELVKQRLVAFLYDCPENWRNEFLKEFEDITDTENPEYYLPDGTPFLSKQVEDEAPSTGATAIEPFGGS